MERSVLLTGTFEAFKPEGLCRGRTEASKTAASTMPASGLSSPVVPLPSTRFRAAEHKADGDYAWPDLLMQLTGFALP